MAWRSAVALVQVEDSAVLKKDSLAVRYSCWWVGGALAVALVGSEQQGRLARMSFPQVARTTDAEPECAE